MLGTGFRRPETAPQAGPEDRFHRDTAPLLPQGLPSCRSGRGLLPVLLQLRLPAAAKSPPTLEPPTPRLTFHSLSRPACVHVAPPSSFLSQDGERPPHSPRPPRPSAHPLASAPSLPTQLSKVAAGFLVTVPREPAGSSTSRQHGRPSPATPLLLATGHPHPCAGSPSTACADWSWPPHPPPLGDVGTSAVSPGTAPLEVQAPAPGFPSPAHRSPWDPGSSGSVHGGRGPGRGVRDTQLLHCTVVSQRPTRAPSGDPQAARGSGTQAVTVRSSHSRSPELRFA